MTLRNFTLRSGTMPRYVWGASNEGWQCSGGFLEIGWSSQIRRVYLSFFSCRLRSTVLHCGAKFELITWFDHSNTSSHQNLPTSCNFFSLFISSLGPASSHLLLSRISLDHFFLPPDARFGDTDTKHGGKERGKRRRGWWQKSWVTTSPMGNSRG